MGRHAKPHNPKEQPPESPEESGSEEQHPSKGRHAKGKQCRPTGTSGEPVSAG
ncbi:hypothetical protein GCM10022224_066080 [Nonomuraea antimicrobica]|uniref:Uncharacterized protein n=1 Tax=Nonomuraea antimicrobica TaxID=561173 RepID=A0ABP7CIL9_9ACTN